jgi:hypothetical protein
MNLEQMTQLFKFMTLINIGILLISAMAIIFLKNIMGKIHGRLFGLQEDQISQVHYSWLGSYKIFILIFNIVPYIALSVMNK